MHTVILGLILSFISSFFPLGADAAEWCNNWVAKAASVKGKVEIRRSGQTQWLPVQRHVAFCPGDVIRVQARSNFAFVARNGTNHRLDENTTITITKSSQKETFLLNLRQGAAYFFSRLPRSLKIITPFVNAGVEGTELFIKVENDQTFLSVFEGKVAAASPEGSLVLTDGQSAVVRAGQAPEQRVVVRPRDAVQWALHYPPIVDFGPSDFPGEADWQAKVRQSISLYQRGDLSRAFAILEKVPPNIDDPRFFIYRAALLLTVGRVEEADIDLKSALQLAPHSSRALAFQSLIAVTQNRKPEALLLAKQAVILEPNAAAQVALSYVQQAYFDLQGALESLKTAVTLPPENALAWARLAELWLSVGNLKKALEAAQRAVALNPQVARTQTVLGFAFLTQIKIRDAQAAFENAIQLDQSAPLPRLGLGLARIRQGELKEGRGEMEIAATLDPNNSLIRSYLGKAYFEEKHDKLAKNQFAIAKELDPQDPTPWFYDAIRKQTVNRPVEALKDLQQSIKLNDNRVVYRSRLLLDEDLAARGTALARIYDHLGFEQLALNEAVKSLALDPTNHSAHRFLSDSYVGQPRQEIARASELLQAQLLQPINTNPVQPSILETDLRLLERIGPGRLGLNEFTSLFERNQINFDFSILGGNNDTFSDEAVVSGIYGPASFSLGQFHYDTDGFRANNDLRHNIYNVFGQVAVTPFIHLQGEYRRRETTQGDLQLNFDPDLFSRDNREQVEKDTARFGLRVTPSPQGDLIASLIYADRTAEQKQVFREPFSLTIEERSKNSSYDAQIQFLSRGSWYSFTIGAGGSHTDIGQRETFREPGIEDEVVPRDSTVKQGNAYVYVNFTYPKRVVWNVGLSFDVFDDENFRLNEFNPKFGVQWQLTESIRLRAAAFKTLKRLLILDQTLEPTQLAGFNQFYDDPNGTRVNRYGLGIDVTFTENIFGGVEASRRDLTVPVIDTGDLNDRREELYRTYLYLILGSEWAASAESRFEKVHVEGQGVNQVETHSLPFALRYFSPSGPFAELTLTYVHQSVELPPSSTLEKNMDDFLLIDAAIGYRLPKRFGLFSLEVRNLFDHKFLFQDLSFINNRRIANHHFVPERMILARLTLNF